MQNPELFESGTLAYGAVVVGEYVDAANCGGAPHPAAALDCSSSLDPHTTESIAHGISQTAPENPFVRDVVVSDFGVCGAPSSAFSVGPKVLVDGECWQHVHDNEYDVHDYSTWAPLHNGNTASFTPIKRFADQGSVFAPFPASHTMYRWTTAAGGPVKRLGTFGSTVDFADLPDEVQTFAMAQEFGAVATASNNVATEVCGSPNEVANDPVLDHRYTFYMSETEYADDSLHRDYAQAYQGGGKSMVHMSAALNARDQLRQRVAWALSQIYVIGESGLRLIANKPSKGEMWHHYYDIFVRHAFGNLRDVIREVSYSPMMGYYLTYEESDSLAFSSTAPDENYAREVMQLFSIGLWELNPDGTQELDATGEPMQTYGSPEIQSFAKVWTGFFKQPSRANIEIAERQRNYLDPMRISPARRDPFPKMDLYHGHLGDGYPLCNDLPPRTFLRRGAKYRYKSTTSMRGQLQTDSNNYDTHTSRRLFLRRGMSALYDKLCWPQPGMPRTGACTFASDVVLDNAAELPCDGVECSIEKPRSVGIVDADNSTVIYYDELKLNARSSFRVRWANGAFPTAATNCSSAVGCRVHRLLTCVCKMETRKETVFTDPSNPPNLADVLASLYIGSVAPDVFDAGEYTQCQTTACTGVASEVAIFTRGGGGFDEHTIFRVSVNETARVIHYANVRSTVHVVGASQHEFRNPPNFMTYQDRSERDAQYEVEAIIDHLFYHKNTAPFIATRMLQRFTSSNPSPRYVRTVADAFKAGAYNGVTYSARYGDLSAMMAATLLDPEATSPILDADPSTGSIREPLLKFMHLMRSMEYVSEDGREIETNTLPIGQRVYQSPTVFSFFLPEYVPLGAAMEANLTAPEGQLITMPYLIGFLNAAASLIRNGLCNCAGGLGGSRGCSSRPDEYKIRTDGYLTWTPSATDAIATVEQLNLLLAAGRLNPSSTAVIASAYNDTLASGGTRERALQMAQEVIIATSEFGTYGDNSQRPKPRMPMAEVPPMNRPYKALVILYLKGGADTWNLLVPHSGCRNASGPHDLYSEYAATRTIAALGQRSLLQIDARGSNQSCDVFGVHPNLPFIKTLYDRGEAAFHANVAALVEPVTKAGMIAKTARLPLSLYAHNLQVAASETVHAQERWSSAGVAGKILTALERDGQYRSAAWSLDGNSKILAGHRHPWVLSPTHGVVQWQRQRDLGWYMNRLHANESASPMAETVGERLSSGVSGVQFMSSQLASTTLLTSFGEGGLAQMFQQVAKVIKTRQARQAERDIFFVQQRGWDHHAGVLQASIDNWAAINNALLNFVAEMQAQGIWESIVVQEASEFGRTMASNGRGTDHGWGGNSFVVGGGLNGTRINGRYPSTMNVQSDAFATGGQGRIIPTSGWESVWKPLAQWLGVRDDRLAEVLPNLNNFPTEDLLSKEQLFRPSQW